MNRSRPNDRLPADEEDRQPLLNDEDRVTSKSSSKVVFSADDDDDGDNDDAEYFEPADPHADGDVHPRSGPPLRSTIQSREAQFELDSDVLEEGENHQHLRRPNHEMAPRRNAASPMPLLIGLADRRSMDVSLPLMADGDLRSGRDDGVRVDLDELAERKNKGGGMFDSIANMANSILGAGIIGLPYALRQAGFFTGIILLVILCGVTDWTIRLIVRNAKLTSGFALVGMLIIVFSVFFEGQRVDPDLKGDPSKRFSVIGSGIFEAIGVISFAFVCHHNSLLIYGSLKTPTLDRFALVTHVSTALSLVCCLLMAVSGYVVFTNKTQGNILNNFSANDTLINVARFCFGLNMFTTLPLELFVCREVIEQYFFYHESFSPQRHLLFTTSILFSSMILSMMTCDLGVMLELTGGISATALAFIFPAACFIKLSDPNLSWTSRTKLPAYLCGGFGLIVMVISIFLGLAKSFSPSEGSTKICV
ncbi:hypothetical protein FS837_008832 [Tulasnella sp. UAMH 9824]|nr:hypothetical protein FS837_008832 [Tulasnella sp. UAMH 9824]